MFENIIETNYEILVVDDSSNDGTDRLVNELSNYNKNIVFISRQNSPSLPLSILKGITEAKYENVMWMDADGSMTIIAMKEIIYMSILIAFCVALAIWNLSYHGFFV